MRRLFGLHLFLLLLPALTVGCDGPGKGGDTAPIVGPKLERLVQQVHSATLPAAEKTAYWRKMQGRIVSATGTIIALPDPLVLRCEMEKTKEIIFVQATLAERRRADLQVLKMDQYLTLTGLLAGTPDPSPALGERVHPFMLRDCTVRLR